MESGRVGCWCLTKKDQERCEIQEQLHHEVCDKLQHNHKRQCQTMRCGHLTNFVVMIACWLHMIDDQGRRQSSVRGQALGI